MSKDKKTRLKKSHIIVIAVVGFFILYFFSFKMSRGYIVKHGGNETAVMNVEDSGEKTKVQKEIETKLKEENKKGALQRFKESKKVYISDDQVKNIKIEGTTLDNFKRSMANFVKVRDVEDGFNPQNEMKSNNNVVLKTDFNYLVASAGNKEECYKIPVSEKEDFQNMYRRMIYTSVEFITNGDKIGKVKLYSGNTEKRVWFWQKKNLIRKILYKREVGKIQPEKEFKKAKENFTIKIDKSGVEVSIQTMGRDFIKVNCGDNIAYYEVYPDLYDYLLQKFSKK